MPAIDLILYFSVYQQNYLLLKADKIVGTKVFLGYEISSVIKKASNLSKIFHLLNKVQYENFLTIWAVSLQYVF